MPQNTLRVPAFADVERQAQQLGRAFDLLAVDDLRDAQVDLGEVVDADGRRRCASPPGSARRRRRPRPAAGRRLEQRVELLRRRRAASGACSRRSCGRAERRRPRRRSRSGSHVQEGFDLRGQRRQHRLQVDRQQAEGLDADACRRRAARASVPSCLASSHGLFWSTYSLTRSASTMISRSALPNSRSSYSARDRRRRARAARRAARGRRADVGRQLAAEALGEEARRAAGDVDVLADQVALTRAMKSSGLKSMSSTLRVELGGDVVAQPLGVHAERRGSLQRVDAGAAALAHLLAADRDEAVHEDAGRAPCGR